MTHGGDPAHPGSKHIEVRGNKLDFVINNGNNEWDSPMGGQNYNISSPGK